MDVLAEDQLVESLQQHVLHLAARVDEHGVAELEHVHVGDDPTLGREQGGVASRPGSEQRDVVREQSVEKRLPVRAADDDPASRAEVDHPRPVTGGGVRVQRVHRPVLDRSGQASAAVSPRPQIADMLRTVMLRVHSIVAVLLVLTASAAVAGPARAQDPAPLSKLLVFMQGRLLGSEESGITSTADGWIVRGTGRLAAPVDLSTTRFEMRIQTASGGLSASKWMARFEAAR